jgi:hypothetical protein
MVKGRPVTIATGKYEGPGPRSNAETSDRATRIGTAFGGVGSGAAVGAAGTAICAALGGPAAGGVGVMIGAAFTDPDVNATIGFIDRGKAVTAPAGDPIRVSPCSTGFHVR